MRAPTLYHHFGSKQALLDGVVSHGFKEFLRERRSAGGTTDPIDDVREGWDNHVAFGLEFPSAYVHIYGNVRPGVPCGVAEDVRAHLLEALEPAARQGRLRVSSAEAAAHILAASSGVTLTLIQQPQGERDLEPVRPSPRQRARRGHHRRDAERPGCERRLDLVGAGDCVGGARERDKGR